jgi:hypothetical protein
LTTASSSVDVVRDDDEPTLVTLEVVAQPSDRVGVEVVGGLVEKQRLGSREQDPGQLDAAPLTAGEGSQRLPEDALVEAEGAGDGCRFGLGCVASGGHELAFEAAVPSHGLVLLLAGGGGHREFGLAQLAHDLVEASRRQDAVAGGDREVDSPGVLGQVAHLTTGRDASRGRLCLPRQRLGQRGLAGTVAAHEPDPVSRRHAEGRVVEQQARAGAQLDGGSGDHERALRAGGGRCAGPVRLRTTAGGRRLV